MVLERFPSKKCGNRESYRSVHIMNFTLLVWCVSMSSIFGIIPFLIIQVTMMAVVWYLRYLVFLVQHQFEDTYWAQGEDWDFTAAAMKVVATTNSPNHAMVLREYWLSSYSPSQCNDSKL